MTAWGKPKECSECSTSLPLATRRPRVVCSKACASKRQKRLLREEKAWDAENARYLEAEKEFFQGRG